MAVSRAERRAERKGRVAVVFEEPHVDAVLDLLELVELAWHDCYNEITPPEPIVDEILLCSDGDLAKLIYVARLSVTDWRDLKLLAEHKRMAH
jgi:hypothetical protein